MKLLSLSFANHDANFSYFDGKKVYYIKAERPLQIKRVHIPIYYYEKFLWDTWKINVNDVDDVVINFDKTEPTFCKKQHQHLIADDSIHALANELLNAYNLKTAWFFPHHLSHALSTWMLPDDKKAKKRIVIDGMGDGKPWSVFDSNNNLIEKGEIKNGSIGWAMRDLGKLIGIKAKHQNDIAGKFMALQSYGNIDQPYLELINQLTIADINKIYDVGEWLEYKKDLLLANMTMIDFARTVHEKTTRIIIDLFKKHVGENDYVSFSGGVAQNVLINTELKKHFKNLIIAPHSSDEGLSLGALEWLRKKHNLATFDLDNFPFVQSDQLVEQPSLETIKETARLLSINKTVGWYQGFGEVGARALGNRSILFNPTATNAKAIVNKIKNRENYRPFGCSILEQYFDEYFDGDKDFYMLLVSKAKKYLPEITHIDNTCRVAVVNQKFNPVFYTLLSEFYNYTNVPILLNTSLNVASRPIAGKPADAMELFYNSSLDVVVIGNNIFSK